MLREADQISLDGGRTIRVQDQAIDGAAARFQRANQVTAVAVTADHAAAMDEPPETGKARRDV